MASRADYADASSDPDARQWVDLVFHEIMQRPLPDQYELRRDVWRVHVVQLDGGTLGAVVGGDCTQTADPAEIASVAEQLRSEEHTSELQSLMRSSYAVFCLKKKITYR